MHCRPTLAGGHGHIIVAVDYFTKWVEAMPTYVKYGKLAVLFFFNNIIARFEIHRAIVTNHGLYFQNKMMPEISAKLGFFHNNSMTCYPQAYG